MKQKMLVVINQNGDTIVYDERFQQLGQGMNLLPKMLEDGWTLTRRSQPTQGGDSEMILIEKESDVLGDETALPSAETSTCCVGPRGG